MHPTHHPTSASQLGYSTSELGAGAALLVGLHRSRCPVCVAHERLREKVDGKARPRLTAERSFAPATAKAEEIVAAPFDVDDIGGFKRGRWWWIAPGVSIATVKGAAGIGERIYLSTLR